MDQKDLFSGHSEVYATFRPTYPEALYQFLFSMVEKKENAWDCATGNGQVAKRLAQDFLMVYASDISTNQIDHAVEAANIQYLCQPAESAFFPEDTFDLITIGQALHWLDHDRFFQEVSRVARTACVFAAWGYGHLRIDADVDKQIARYYSEVVGRYWDERRHMVEDQYASINFPFSIINDPGFTIRVNWTREHLEGYLESWSATQGFIRDRGFNPVRDLSEILRRGWKDNVYRQIEFPLFLKAGLIEKN